MATGIVLFDATCNLCDGAIAFITARDPQRRFTFVPLGSAAAERVLAPFGRTDPASDSIVLIDAEGLHERSDAALRIAAGLPAPWHLLAALTRIPAPVRDYVYRLIARNRYRWFGRKAVCAILAAGVSAGGSVADTGNGPSFKRG